MVEMVVATGDGVARIQVDGDKGEVRNLFVGNGLQCLAVDHQHPSTIFSGSRGSGIWRTQDDGAHWDALRFPQADVFSIAVSPADGYIYVGTEPSMLFRSRDQGETWEELAGLRRLPSAPTWSFPPRPWTSHVRWIAPSPHAADLILVGIELGGLMRSTDGGETWQDHRPGAQRDVHALAWHPRVPGYAYEAGGGGSAWSQDRGETWQPADDGRLRHYTWGLAVDPLDPDVWFVSASTGPGAAHSGANAQAGIFRWKDRGPWQVLTEGLPQPLKPMPYALAATDTALIAGMSDGSLYVSYDRGDRWLKPNLSGDRLKSILALAIS